MKSEEMEDTYLVPLRFTRGLGENGGESGLSVGLETPLIIYCFFFLILNPYLFLLPPLRALSLNERLSNVGHGEESSVC